MPSVRTVDARWAYHAVKRLRSEKIPADPILKAAGLRRSQVSNPDNKIPFHKHAALLTLAAEATSDDFFGLHLGSSLRLRQAGVLGFLMLNSETLGDALSNLVRYVRVLSEGPEVSLKVDRKEAVLSGIIVDPLVVDQRQAVEAGAGFLHHMCQIITGSKDVLKRVEFNHPRPRGASELRRWFGASVRFEQERFAIVMKRELLDHPLAVADYELLKILRRHCRQILGRRPRTKELIFDVRETIIKLLPRGHPTMKIVARELGMGDRTLARRLAERGQSFKNLVDDVRRELSFQYLKDENIDVKQIAYLLGYSEVAAFNHAFKRWTGSTPSSFRN